MCSLLSKLVQAHIANFGFNFIKTLLTEILKLKLIYIFSFDSNDSVLRRINFQTAGGINSLCETKQRVGRLASRKIQ